MNWYSLRLLTWLKKLLRITASGVIPRADLPPAKVPTAPLQDRIAVNAFTTEDFTVRYTQRLRGDTIEALDVRIVCHPPVYAAGGNVQLLYSMCGFCQCSCHQAGARSCSECVPCR